MAASPNAVALPTPVSGSAAIRTGIAGLALLSFAHFMIDLYSAALGALQPLLLAKFGFSLTQAGILGGLLLLSSSLLQPVYGYLSDRLHSRLFTVLAPAMAGIFISALGLAPSYLWCIALVILGGAGIASFHPQASARVTHGVATARGAWMAIFISAGTLGMALGPTFFSLIPARFGLENTHWAAVPGVLCTILLWFTLSETPVSTTRRKYDLSAFREARRPLTLLFFCVFVRSVVQVTYAQLLPLYLSRERHMTVAVANYTLSLYLMFGAIGGFLGGRLADRIGGRKVIMFSFAGSVPFLLLFFFASGPASIVGLLLGGLILLFTIPVNVVMAQDLAPAQTGTVSALMMGFAWGSSGLIFVPLTGWASDHYGMHASMLALAFFPLIGFFLAKALPDIRHGS